MRSDEAHPAARSLPIVLTYAVGAEDRSIGLESSAVPFFREVLQAYDRVVFAALVNRGQRVKGLEYVEDQGFLLDELARVKPRDTRLRRVSVYVTAAARIARSAWKRNYFYVFAPSHVSAMFMLACVCLRRRYAVYLRGDWDVVTPLPIRPLKRLLLSRADFVLVTGDRFLREVREYQPMCRKVVPMLSLPIQRAEVIRDFSLRAGARVLFVGQVIREKGVFELLEAFRSLRRTHPDAELTFAGEGEATADLLAAATAYGLSDCVRCTGYVSDRTELGALYAESDLFVLPTYFPEGFPRVVYEAMLYRLPIITTNAGGMADVMVSGENCLLVRQRDACDLERALLRLVADQDLRARIGRAGHQTVTRVLNEVQADTMSHARQFLTLAGRCGWPCKPAGHAPSQFSPVGHASR